MNLLAARLAPAYNCAHFLVDAWLAETQVDLGRELASFLGATWSADHSLVGSFRRILRPASPCIVLLRRVRVAPHVGMYVRGRVLHLTDRGPIRQLLSVASIGYTSVRFYAPR